MALVPQVARAGDKGLLDVHDEPVHPLGSIFKDQETGYVWQYLKAGDDLNYGDAVKPWYEMLPTVTNLANAAGAGTRELNVGNSVDLLASTGNLRHVKNRSRQKEYAMLHVNSDTGQGQIGVILDIEDHKLVVEWLTEDGSLETALDTTSDLKFFAPWFAKKTDGDDEATLAVIQQWDGVKTNEYFWGANCAIGAIRFYTPATQAALTAGDRLTTTDGSDGAVVGNVADTEHTTAIALTTTEETEFTASSSVIIPALIRCELMPGEVPVRHDVGYTASTTAPPAAA